MKTMLGVTFDYLKEVKTAAYTDIWAKVQSEMTEQWAEMFPKMSEKKINDTKIAELYTLLTVSGEFVRTPEDKFGLVEDFTYQEVQAMKVNIGEIKE